MKTRDDRTIAHLTAIAALITALFALAGCRPPILAGGILTPPAGGEATLFTYQVFYHDGDGHAPALIEVVIDGTSHPMVLASGDPHDGLYQYQANLPLGEHSYYFLCDDGHDGTARFPTEGEIEGPSVFAGIGSFSFASSGCIQDKGAGQEEGERSTCEGISIWTEGDDIVMEHFGAMYNCCTGMTVDLDAAGSLFRLIERPEFPDWKCHCICPYDLTSRIEDVPPGTYRVEVWDPTEHVLLCEQEVTIYESSYSWDGCVEPESYSAVREDCEPGVTILVEEATVSLDHLGAIYNCCAEMVVELVTVGSTIMFVEVETFPIEPCSCSCPFDITAEVQGVSPGTYWVEVWNEGFTHLYCREQVEVGGA